MSKITYPSLNEFAESIIKADNTISVVVKSLAELSIGASILYALLLLLFLYHDQHLLHFAESF